MILTTTKPLIDVSRLKPVHRERIQLWCDTLRNSGDRYPKGDKVIRDINDCYCVMGVACDISKLGQWQYYQRSESQKDYLKECYIYSTGDTRDDWHYGALPTSVFEWYGFHFADTSPYVNDNNVLVIDPNDSTALVNISYLNDIYGFTFAQIADTLELSYLQK